MTRLIPIDSRDGAPGQTASDKLTKALQPTALRAAAEPSL